MTSHARRPRSGTSRARRSRSLPEPPVRALRWTGDWRTGALLVLDQTLLPGRERTLRRTRWTDVVRDIERLAVRGAPAIGVAAAFGMALAAREAATRARTPEDFRGRLHAAAGALRDARPTAVNLARAVDASLAAVARSAAGAPAARRLLDAALALEAREARASERIGLHGAAWLEGRERLLTHCNAGALVTPGLGTALAPVYVLHHRGHPVHLWVDETRPLLQGLRLTAYELRKAGVPHAVIPDGAAAGLMARGEVDAIVVGADRVCRNGDVANKVGTYPLALAARRHGVPFVVAAPLSTLDPDTPSGSRVRIEVRSGDAGVYLAPGVLHRRTSVHAPAFDVTPASLVSALVTDAGVLERPRTASLAGWMARSSRLQRPGRSRR